MPGKYGSPSVWFRVDGYNLLTSKLKSLRYKIISRTEDTTGLGDIPESHTPTGISAIELAQDGALFDTDTGGAHAALAAGMPADPQTVPRVVCLGMSGTTVGEPFVGMEGTFQIAYDVVAENGGLTKANAEYRVSGRLDRGVIVQPLATESIDWNATNTVFVDYTLDSTQRVIPITSNSIANPTVVTTPVPHGLTTGDIILISGVSTSSPTINGERTVTVITATTFSVPVNVTTGGTGGSFVRSDTRNGGAGYIQIESISGLSNFAGTLRDSTDNVTYASLLAFTQGITAPRAERLTVAGTVDRYISFFGDVSGGPGAIRIIAGFARF
jgi:hypothetical protein